MLTFGETNKLQNKISSWSVIVSKYSVVYGSPLCFACCQSVHEVIEFVQSENRTTRALLTSMSAARIFEMNATEPEWEIEFNIGSLGVLSSSNQLSIVLSLYFIHSRRNGNLHWAQSVLRLRFRFRSSEDIFILHFYLHFVIHIYPTFYVIVMNCKIARTEIACGQNSRNYFKVKITLCWPKWHQEF